MEVELHIPTLQCITNDHDSQLHRGHDYVHALIKHVPSNITRKWINLSCKHSN